MADRVSRVAIAAVLTASVAGKVLDPAPTLRVLTDVWTLPNWLAGGTFAALLAVEAALAAAMLLVAGGRAYLALVLFLAVVSLSPAAATGNAGQRARAEPRPHPLLRGDDDGYDPQPRNLRTKGIIVIRSIKPVAAATLACAAVLSVIQVAAAGPLTNLLIGETVETVVETIEAAEFCCTSAPNRQGDPSFGTKKSCKFCFNGCRRPLPGGIYVGGDLVRLPPPSCN